MNKKGEIKQKLFVRMEEEGEAIVGKVVSIDNRSRDRSVHHTSSFVLSAIMRWNPIPTPSMTARKTAHMIAEFRAAL